MKSCSLNVLQLPHCHGGFEQGLRIGHGFVHFNLDLRLSLDQSGQSLRRLENCGVRLPPQPVLVAFSRCAKFHDRFLPADLSEYLKTR